LLRQNTLAKMTQRRMACCAIVDSALAPAGGKEPVCDPASALFSRYRRYYIQDLRGRL